MRKKPVIFFLGKSGCGKDTQAALLIKHKDFYMINSGAILRELASDKNLAKLKVGAMDKYQAATVRKIIDSGKFVPTLTIVCQWLYPLLETVSSPKRVPGVVFTGSPRKLAEALLLDEFFKNWPDAAKNFKVFPLEIKLFDKEVFRRLLTRKQCEKCEKIFSAKELTKIQNCNECGGELIKRKDDTESGVQARLREYRDYVVPVLNYFKSEKKLKTINGEQTIEKVHKDIIKMIKL